jgi:hypothetical protein
MNEDMPELKSENTRDDTAHDGGIDTTTDTTNDESTATRISKSNASNLRSMNKMDKLRRLESHLGLSTTSPIPIEHMITPLTSINARPRVIPRERRRRGDVHVYKLPSTNHYTFDTGDDEKNDSDDDVNIIDLDEEIAAKTNEVQFRRKTFWKSCCGVVDRRAIQYFVQVAIGIIIILFCMYKISTSPIRICNSEDDNTVFIALISTVIGWFLPSPKFG